jgi:3-methyladenine DNA glycosylase AlkD
MANEEGPSMVHPLSRAVRRDLKRRAAIICQVGREAAKDLDLLYHCVRTTMGEREFFIRKGIGCALRDYAWTDPAEVRRFVARDAGELSALSKREALKNATDGSL